MTLREPIDVIAGFFLVLAWLYGAVLAHGFWSTVFALFFPPWGWYLIVEKIAIASGLA